MIAADLKPDAATLEKTETLIEALPYLKRYRGATFVVKFGGHAMVDERLARDFAQDVVLLKHVGINPVVVHGGGPQIGSMLKRLGIKSEFVDGLRITDAATAQVAEMVLAGSINSEIVNSINRAGGSAVGVSGKDAGFVTARKVTRTVVDPDSEIERIIDLGFVGEPTVVDARFIKLLTDSDVIPVVAPIAVDERGDTYNINADTMAGAVAGALRASRLVLLTDVPGVLEPSGALLTDLVPGDIPELIANGTVKGGMIPKLETCIGALRDGVDAAVILDGRIPHALLLEIFTRQGAGTLIRPSR
jgi:acetylglutamate kinase